VELEGVYQDIKAERAELIAISVDSVADAQRMVDHAGASFPVLSDEDHLVTQNYGLFDLLNDGVSAPATLILNRDRDLIGSQVGTNIADRASAESILRFLQKRNDTLPGTNG
jgi:peroxiredoxin